MKTRGKIFIAVLVLAATIFIWTSLPNNVYEDVYSGEFDEPITQGNNEEISWRDITLKDTLTSQEYKISDYDGQVIILETFAVWCPTCRKQQQEIKKLIDSGDNSIHISLDIDPNEDEEKVKGHAEKNGFEWFFSVSPVSLTKELIEEFGPTVANAPQAPTIIICPDGNVQLLENGVKDSGELAQHIASC
ncbi:redoxin family protein [archaeon]|jgi:hypothetical protein|nr:redoxin family protein [archaeon]MBT6183045.1 redoxin family protein [archaeon]MBT6606375.1 redoxin family protein [archaeon]MBT7251456.1 redoxin family protein [archaeon]MBT7661242.1 redoxin family protein [archaeon]